MTELRLPYNRIKNPLLIVLIAAFFISSDDILFVIDIPFTLRLSFVLLSLFILVGAADLTSRKRLIVPLGFEFLLAWCAFSAVSLMFSPVFGFSFVQTIFFYFDVAIVFLVTNFVSEKYFLRVFEFYLMSFAAIAFFGLVQFALALIDIHLLVTQFWSSHLARINGLNYEPSFYAIYLSAGLITLGYLKFIKYKEIRHIGLWYNLCLAAMILSSSRTGLLLVILWYARLFPSIFMDLLRGRVKRASLYSIFAVILFSIAVTSAVIVEGVYKFWFLLQGTGFAGTASHSVDDRAAYLEETIKVFLNHPLFGVGIGGFNYYEAQVQYGVVTFDPGILKGATGTSVIVEVLSSIGIVGFVFVVAYFSSFAIRAFRVRRQQPVVVALTLGLFAEFFLLQFAQDIERVYFWLHIAMLSSAISVYRNLKTK